MANVDIWKALRVGEVPSELFDRLLQRAPSGQVQSAEQQGTAQGAAIAPAHYVG